MSDKVSRKAGPLAKALREAIEESNTTVTELATLVGVQRGTFSAKLNGGIVLDPKRAKDQEFIRKVAKETILSYDEIFRRAQQIEQEEANASPAKEVDKELLEILLDNLGDPNTSEEKKAILKKKILDMT